jgi:molybdenum cofactor guanylyltransferase
LADRAGLTGVLLVGGASTRFGSPKAHAQLDGLTLAEIAWETLGDACDERLAVGKRADGLELPFEVVDDRADVRAPLAGLVAGLRAASTDAAVPGRMSPLPGAYARTALPVLARRLATGALALRDALAELDVREVALDPALLVNVNTPAELEALQRPETGSSPWGATTRSRSAPVPTSETSTSSSRSTNST